MSNCAHITSQELHRYFLLDKFVRSSEDEQLYHSVKQRIQSCPYCRAQYMNAIDSKVLVSAYTITPKAYFLAIVADALNEKLDIWGPSLVQKLRSWLSTSKEFLNSFESASFSSMRPAIASRGETKPTPQKIITLTPQEATCSFSVDEETDFVFKAARSSPEGEALCIVITGQNETDYGEVFALTGLELPGLVSDTVSSPTIRLQKGEYILCVPVLK